MKTRRQRTSRVADGFTFVEILAALTFLAVVVPAIIGAATMAGRAGVTAERATIATELAENKLGEMLVGNAWSTASGTKGECGTDWPGYRYEVSTSDWTGDATNRMTEIDVDVFYSVQGAERSVHLSTLVDPNAPTPTPSTQ